MTLETKSSLAASTIAKLQDLIRINIDSDNGFRESAKQMEDESVARLFTDIATQRAKNATELQKFVEWNGEKAQKEGSFLAAFHRAWIDVRSAISGGDTHVILSEAERGEDTIKQMYEDALKETAGSAVNDVLTRQYSNVKAGHDKVRDLRDSYAKS